MFWRGLSIAGVVLAGWPALGCLNTEADFQALLEENNVLSEELSEVKRDNEILTRALDDIRREEEALQLLLSAGKNSLNAGRASLPSVAVAADGDQAQVSGGDLDEMQTPRPPAAPTAPTTQAQNPGGRYYVTKAGDVLSYIARANDTTVARLLELNPNLRNRRDYMIYANERLRLP
jgi:LysM repeat protein